LIAPTGRRRLTGSHVVQLGVAPSWSVTPTILFTSGINSSRYAVVVFTSAR